MPGEAGSPQPRTRAAQRPATPHRAQVQHGAVAVAGDVRAGHRRVRAVQRLRAPTPLIRARIGDICTGLARTPAAPELLAP